VLEAVSANAGVDEPVELQSETRRVLEDLYARLNSESETPVHSDALASIPDSLQMTSEWSSCMCLLADDANDKPGQWDRLNGNGTSC